MLENTGGNRTERVLQMLVSEQKTIVILCGTRNNGGSGIVAARHLHNRGANGHLLCVGRGGFKDIPDLQWKILAEMGLRDEPDFNLLGVNLIVDTVIGYGLVGNPRREVATVIEEVNVCGMPVLSLDAASGRTQAWEHRASLVSTRAAR